VPRNRSVRLAALGASAPRTATPSYGGRANGALRRRIVVAALVLASLAMITGYFRESEAGALHDAQSAGAQALEPFQIGAARLVRPFRDAWGWFDGLRDARSENEALRRQVDEYRKLALQPPAARQTPDLGIERSVAPTYPSDYQPLLAEVILDLQVYRQVIVISAGKADGVRRFDPVVTTRNFLAGHVSKVARTTAEVTLLYDRQSAVAAYDWETNAKGLLRGRGAGTSTLVLDRVPKEKVVKADDHVRTAGRLSGEQYESFYPGDISVGRVTHVGQSDTDQYKLVQVQPFANLTDLDRIVVLRRSKPLPTLP
jgi:rod shape-determining protein MreC